MSAEEIIGLVVGVLTIAGVIVAVTRHITQLQLQIRIERLEAEKNENERARSDLAAANRLLLDELAAARRTGAAASAKKAEVDEELTSLVRITGAGAGSVYLPLMAGDSDRPVGLIFLSILPITEETAKLRSKFIPLHSLAGRCLTTNMPSAVSNAKSVSDHFEKADEVSGYRTHDTITYPLRAAEKVVGVLQLLNKRGGNRFSESDLHRVEQLATALARKVDDFSRMPGSKELLGIVQERNSESATIMFCDLSASSLLFDALNVSAAIQHINEYFTTICDVVFRHGGTIDKYAGDGVLFRFNVPHPVEDHPSVAVHCAIAIQDAFANLKNDWLTMGEALADVHCRVGLAYGPVQQALVGHPQYQYSTIFGTPVNAAVNLCDVAARNRGSIVIDHALYERVQRSARVHELPSAELGKARKYSSAWYEVLGLTRDSDVLQA